MVPAGSSLTFDIRGTAGGWSFTTTDAVREALIAALQSDFVVQSVTIAGQGSFYELMEWQFSGRVVVKPLSAYGAIDDVASMVTHAIYEATGSLGTAGPTGSQGAVGGSGGIMDSVTNTVAALGTGIQNAIAGLGTAVGQGVGNATKPVADEIGDLLGKGLIIVGVVLVAGIFILSGKTTRVGLK